MHFFHSAETAVFTKGLVLVKLAVIQYKLLS